jgi:hypothetical protein
VLKNSAELPKKTFGLIMRFILRRGEFIP